MTSTSSLRIRRRNSSRDDSCAIKRGFLVLGEPVGASCESGQGIGLREMYDVTTSLSQLSIRLYVNRGCCYTREIESKRERLSRNNRPFAKYRQRNATIYRRKSHYLPLFAENAGSPSFTSKQFSRISLYLRRSYIYEL